MEHGAKAMEKVVKSDLEWLKELTPEQYYVCRAKGTERPFSGKLLKEKREGVYVCVCCGAELFASDAKYDSGTGWPSFYRPLGDEHVATECDSSLGMERTEVLCARCEAHLGHVFPDGPEPTGQRYCMNSTALAFKPSR